MNAVNDKHKKKVLVLRDVSFGVSVNGPECIPVLGGDFHPLNLNKPILRW